MQKHSVQDSGSFVGEIVDDLLRRNLDQLGRGRPAGLGVRFDDGMHSPGL